MPASSLPSFVAAVGRASLLGAAGALSFAHPLFSRCGFLWWAPQVLVGLGGAAVRTQHSQVNEQEMLQARGARMELATHA